MSNNTRIWHISDTHTYHNLLTIPQGIDMVIHSGDCSNPRDPYTNEPEVRAFIHWFKSLPIKHKIYVAGNHDTSIEKKLITKNDFQDYNIIYLEDDLVEIDGLTIYGNPYTPNFGNWAFMKDRVKLDRYWVHAIPDYVDILVTHGPPKGILDKSYDRNNYMECCGDKSLFNKVMEVQPAYHLFGHLHNCKDVVNAGMQKLSVCDTWFSNGSVVTDGKFVTLSSNGNIFEINN
jgi:Icc-related predicted phosphoesterase